MKKHPINNRTYDEAIKGIEWTLINDSRTYPDFGWLFGSDWLAAGSTDAMTRTQYVMMVYDKCDAMYTQLDKE